MAPAPRLLLQEEGDWGVRQVLQEYGISRDLVPRFVVTCPHSLPRQVTLNKTSARVDGCPRLLLPCC
jgi:hypothetical protein